MCRIWKHIVHPCMLQGYILSSRSLSGNVKTALCVTFLHLQAICDLNCMPFFSRLCSKLYACINSSNFRPQFPSLSVAKGRLFLNSEIRMTERFSVAYAQKRDIHENRRLQLQKVSQACLL